jgi:hypothetical protein
VKSWQIRIPARWDIGEETKFRRLLRRKVDQDILNFEIAALRTLTPEEFFLSRPYLVPPQVESIKGLDANLYGKLLRILHGKYKSAMMKRKIKMLNDKENKWLMEKLGIVFERAYIITKKEIVWLTQQKQQSVKKDSEIIPFSLGNPPGSRLEELALQPSVTDSLSAKTSSGRDMNVEAVVEKERSTALTVEEQVATAENEGMK